MTEIDEIMRIREQADLLFSEQQIDSAIERMADSISQTMAESNPLLLCIVNGGIPLTAQLMLHCDFPMTNDIVYATRYQGATVGNEISWLVKPQQSIEGRTVLLVDDILDEGITLRAISEYCKDQGAGEVYSAVLIDKKLDKTKPIQADFVGLVAENRYLFGYGMDYKGYHRNLRGIYACRTD